MGKGTYQLRKFKGKDGKVREYWYRYWWDSDTKKMKCKREDPPEEAIRENPPENISEAPAPVTNGIGKQLEALVKLAESQEWMVKNRRGELKDTHKVKWFFESIILPLLEA